MSRKPEAVLVVGRREHENETALVRALGYQVLYVNSTISLEDALRVDVPVELDLNNEDAVLAHALVLARRFTVRAVYTLNEYRVPLACRIAAALELHHSLPVAAALNCRHKQRTKGLLAQHGVGTARFALVRTPHEALAVLRTLPLPVVVKPCNDAGSRLVHRCATPEAVQDAVEAIRRQERNAVGQAFDPDILLEEYLDGPEYSVEACTAGGRTTILALTTKQITPWPYTVETGYMVPAPLTDAETQALHAIVTRALAVLGVDQAVTHTEVKLTPAGARIVEVNARPAGHPIPTLVRAVTGYDLHEVALHMALGHGLEAVPRYPILAPSAAGRDLIAEQDGILAMHEEVLSETPAVQLIDLTVHAGALVEQATSNDNQFGCFVVYGTDARDADAIADDVLRRLNIRVTPQTVCTTTTEHYHLVVTDLGAVRQLHFGDSHQGSMSLADPLKSSCTYTEYFHLAWVFKRDIQTVLFLGLGGGAAPKQFQAAYPEIAIDVVEIDPMVVEVAERYFHFRSGPRLQVLVEDAGAYLRRTDKCYDLIVHDAYDSDTVPYHLRTREFFHMAVMRLTPTGIFAFNLVSDEVGPDRLETRLFRDVYTSWQVLFPAVYVFPVEAARNIVLLGSRVGETLAPDEVVQRATRLRDAWGHVPGLETYAKRLTTRQMLCRSVSHRACPRA